MRVFERQARDGGVAMARGPGGHGRVVALVGAALLAIPLVSLGATAAARGGRPEAAARVCANGTYTVLSGDSWSRISSRLHVTMSALLVANNATTGIVIHPGDLLCIPAGASTVTTAVPPTTVATPPVTAPTTVSPPTATTTTVAGTTLGPLSIRQFPVQGMCWYTDSYGAPRSGGRKHEGVDIIAKTGQFIYAADDGTLTKQYLDAPGLLAGNGWRLTRTDGTYYFYGHMSAFAPGLKVGSIVKAGQILGRVGMTGNAGTPHLHFEVHPRGGASVDPTPVVRAVNGCSTTVVPAQPGAATPTTVPPTTVRPATTVPKTTVPKTTGPTTTVHASVPPTTVPHTTVPPTTRPPTTPPPTTLPLAARNAAPTLWQFIAPVTAFDSAGARLVPGRLVPVSVTAVKGVAPATTGVMVRIAARNVTSAGWVSLRACSGAATTTTTLSFAPGQPNATTTIVPVVAGGFCVVANAAVDVRIAVIAFQGSSGVGMQPIPARLALDTRSSSPIPAGGSRAVRLPALGASVGTTAVTVTITILGATADGAIGVGACGGSPWIIPFKARPVLVLSGVMRVNDAGLCLTSTVAANVVVESTGLWTGAGTLGAAAPVRLYDSRTSGAISPSGTGVHLVIPTGSTRAQVTVTALSTSGALLRVWNCAGAAGTTMTVPAGVAMSVTIGLSVAGGSLCIASSAPLHAIVDLTAVG